MPDRDTFDSRPHPPKPRRESHHSRSDRRSRRKEDLPFPVPDWSYVVEAPVERPEERRKKSKCCKRIRLYISLIFLAGYLALVVLLVSMMLSERKLLEAPGQDSAECQQKLCPVESPCQIQENEARCVFVSVSNLHAIEVILGLVVGVPLVICIPCTLHWLYQRLRGKSWGARSKSNSYVPSDVHGTILGRQEDMDHRNSEDSNKALKPSAPKGPPSDDGLDDLFTPLAKNPVEAAATQVAEDELDLLFAPKPRAAGASSGTKGATKEDMAPSMVSAMESELSALFHRKPMSSKRKSPGEAKGWKAKENFPDAMSDLHSNFSEGMSVLFASLKQLQHQAETAQSPQPQEAKSVISDDKMDLADEDLGDPPDFFAYAQRLARKAQGHHIRDEETEPLERTASEDSLGQLEPDDLAELFHPPL